MVRAVSEYRGTLARQLRIEQRGVGAPRVPAPELPARGGYCCATTGGLCSTAARMYAGSLASMHTKLKSSCFGDHACSLVSADWRNMTCLAILSQYSPATRSALRFVSA